MQEIRVQTTRKSYRVIVGESIYDEKLRQVLSGLGPYTQLVLVSHPRILELHGSRVIETLDSKEELAIFSFPEGERNKSFATLEAGCLRLLEKGINRNGILLAFGGGVVGDLGGYLAASYLRGIRLIQLPTTLMAMVDSSIGGKVGIDLPGAKNAIGTFYQPDAVISNLDVLKSLELREIKSGMAEIAKYAFLYDARMLDENWCLDSLDDIKDLEWLITRCVQLKGRIVQADELDITGERAILNYGHTFGHALESSTGYGFFRHGEAIAVGMMMAARTAEIAGIAGPGLFGMHREILRPLLKGLSIPAEVKAGDILNDMERDKKRTESLRFVLLSDVNRPCLVDSLPSDVIRAAIEDVIEDLKEN